MSTLKFTDVHNLVTFLSKHTESEGFKQIIDFLNGNPIKYALMVNPTVYTSCIEQFWATATNKNINGEAQIHAKVTGKKVIISKGTVRRDLKFEDKGGVDCLSYKVIFEQLPFMGDTPLFPIMLVPAQEEELGKANVAHEALNKENVPAQSNDPPISKVNTLRSEKDNLKLNELMEVCTKLSDRVLNMEITKTAQAKEISSLKKRVKRLKKKRRSRTHGLKRLYKIGLSARVESYAKEQSFYEKDASKQGRNIADIDADAEINLVDETAEDQGSADVILDELTIAQALVEIKKSKPKGATTTTTTVTIPTPNSSRPKARGVVMQEPSETLTTTTIPRSSKVQDKRKGIMVEELLKMKKKDQISFDEKEARRLQDEIDEQDRLAEEKA
uniref:Xylulose kinase-1 n=1 Tax=Tanacetum cinerariifolium TaxID=118510 RepID=A0A6L2LZD5_TANCI|nr:hypothetical protein [Tanacetum cinerariifolium]